MKEIDYKAIGARIKYYRNQRNITQAQLAETSSVEPSNISHIERGATKVSLPTLFKIANALEVSLDDLVYDSLEKTQHISNKELNHIHRQSYPPRYKQCHSHISPRYPHGRLFRPHPNQKR